MVGPLTLGGNLYYVDLDSYLGIQVYARFRPSLLSIGAYPNPFNSAVTITVDAPIGAYCNTPLQIEILDISGRRVETLRPSATSLEKGGQWGSFTWQPNATIGSGVYLVRARVGDESVTKRVVYLK